MPAQWEVVPEPQWPQPDQAVTFGFKPTWTRFPAPLGGQCPGAPGSGSPGRRRLS